MAFKNPASDTHDSPGWNPVLKEWWASLSCFFKSDTTKIVDHEQKESCEGLLTVEECKEALKSFSRSKSRGMDGLYAEFYSFFWDLLFGTMVNSFNYGFQKGELAISQKQSVIRLIPKTDKDLSRLKYWCPISLLNLDYKIAKKALALRLKVAPYSFNSMYTWRRMKNYKRTICFSFELKLLAFTVKISNTSGISFSLTWV